MKPSKILFWVVITGIVVMVFVWISKSSDRYDGNKDQFKKNKEESSESILYQSLYGAPVWCDKTKEKCYSKLTLFYDGNLIRDSGTKDAPPMSKIITASDIARVIDLINKTGILQKRCTRDYEKVIYETSELITISVGGETVHPSTDGCSNEVYSIESFVQSL
ncbi:MAG TPA: hypothetical protein VI981_00020 [Candidatus Paceibacterota bacterium]